MKVFTQRVLRMLDANEFEGTDASMTISLMEYGGLYSTKLQAAVLVECRDGGDPGIQFMHIEEDEIALQVRRAGAGYLSFVDAENCGVPSKMDAIHSLMMWNGGWHENSALWPTLSSWREREMLENIRDLKQIINTATHGKKGDGQ